MPPSVRSILPPTSGQLSEKRSPPLSLVKTTSVSSPRPPVVERVEQAADAFVHLADHLLVDADRAAVLVADVGVDLGARAAVGAALPRPVRRRVVQAQQERLAIGRALAHVGDRMVAQQVGEVAAVAVELLAVLHQVVVAFAVEMAEVADAAGERPDVLLVAALERPEMRRVAQMPLADQGGAVAGRLQAATAGSDATAAGRPRCCRRSARSSAPRPRRAAGTGSGR